MNAQERLKLAYHAWRARWGTYREARSVVLIPHAPPDGSATVVWAEADRRQTDRLLERLFPEGLDPAVGREHLPLDRLLAASPPSDLHLAAFRSGLLLGMRLRRAGWHLHLRWVDVCIDLGGGTDAVLRIASRNVRRSLDALRSEGWTVSVSTDDADLERFHAEMYLPTLEQRYGDRATRFDLGSLREMLRRGFLLKAIHGGRWLAADLAVVCGRELWLAVAGIQGGSEDVRRSNVATLLTEAALRRAEASGLSRVNHGGSMGFADEGTLLYKTRWGGVPEARGYSLRGGRFYARDWTDVALWCDPKAPGVPEALDRALPIVDEGHRTGALAGTKPRPGDFRRLGERFGWSVLASAEP
ncbi:MAG: GNAT family N-acetyltransferase [Fimbriimonadaceae bacterium]